MKIFLSRKTAGRHGGGLNGNLFYLDRLIQNELNKVAFTSSFTELWLTLSYPPMYILPGIVGMEIDFQKYYDTLPYSMLNRRHKKIDISLKAPELSEHIDKQEQSKYQHQFDIESRYKNISEPELARILINKYIEAGEIISSKLKKEDDFNFEKFKTTLLALRETITNDSLTTLIHAQKTVVIETGLKRAIEVREKRKKQNLPKDKLIQDLRVYYKSLPTKALYPYDFQYTEIFLNILRRKEFKCPVYHHLYIQVAETMAEALRRSLSIEDWYINGVAVLDYENYMKQAENDKEEIVFNTIVSGLRDITSIDKLDNNILEETISIIQKTGLNTELEFQNIENDNYKLTITYFARSMEEQCPIFFNLTEKSTHKFKKTQIGKADKSQIYVWLQKVTLTNKKIKVKASTSVRAGVWLKDKPRTMEFEIIDMLK